MADSPRYTMLVNTDSLRWQHYHRELLRYWETRRRVPEIHCIDWREVIARDGKAAALLSSSPSVFRMDSPARGKDVEQALLRAGERSRGLPESEWDFPRPGCLASPKLLHAGFLAVLHELQQAIDAGPWLAPRPPSSLGADVALLFDKNGASERLAALGLPVPETFAPSADVEELFEELRRRGIRYAFLKLSSSSCAAGILAFRTTGAEPRGLATMVELDDGFYNTRRLRTVAGEELRRYAAFLLREGATVQRAVPKTEVDGQNFDVRFVVVRGQLAATIFRASPHPMTNLHLGGRRADEASCRSVINNRQWHDAVEFALAAAADFTLPTVGVDVVFERRSSQPYIVEMNAFGDFFPHWTDARGRSIYAIDIAACAREMDEGVVG